MNIAKGVSFEIKFTYKKDKQQSITMLNKLWKPKTGSYCLFRKISAAELFPEALVYDSRLIETKTGRYYLYAPKALEIRREN